MQEIALTIYSIGILIMSVAIHEVMHGLVAFWNGDVTAKYQGRLTLNPARHFDLIGSFIVPVVAYVTTAGAAVFGWAKPVPVNPYNLRNERWGMLAVAFAGPASNLAIAAILGLALRAVVSAGLLNHAILVMFAMPIFTNIVLALFNLIPVPPFDGFKILSSIIDLPRETAMFLEQYGFIFVIVAVFYVWDRLYPAVEGIFTLLTGLQ